ncbi:HEPN domain-containing protein [Candidatus Termititenax persephonae]|uniref:HEPN domain-containing protein n=1 Tax=Candidatus Termititenax persephonae TaxID=2218525 RepID=A0A388THD3_9BACT|nr:HEPN domain-containing protein [Candidatus Termititenax persephonae]
MKKAIEDWLNFADKDIELSETIFKLADAERFMSFVAFHCQQAVEKYFKAFILENKLPLLKIHNLVKLYSDIKRFNDLDIDADLLGLLNNAYVKTRYPANIGLVADNVPSLEQSLGFLNLAKDVAKKIRKALS